MKCTYILLCKMLYGWSDMWKQQNLLSSARINHCLYMFEVLPQYFVQWWMFNYQADVTVSCFSTKIILKGYKCLYYSFWYFFFQAFKIMLWRLPAYLSTKPSILLIIFYVCMYTVFSIIYKQTHEVQWNYTHEARGIFMEVYSYNQNLRKTASV